MALDKEMGDAIVAQRAQIVYSVLKKVSVGKKNQAMKIAKWARMTTDYADENMDKILADNLWLEEGRSTSFLTSIPWFKRHIQPIKVEAAADGHAFIPARRKNRWAGYELTRDEKKIQGMAIREAKSVETKVERHNELCETLNDNARYQLRLPVFNSLLLERPGK